MIFDEAEEIKQSDLIHNKNMIEEEEELLEDVLEEDEMDEEEVSLDMQTGIKIEGNIGGQGGNASTTITDKEFYKAM